MKKYEDGIPTEDGEDVEKFIMAHCSGKDLATIIYGCAQLGVELGYFD